VQSPKCELLGDVQVEVIQSESCKIGHEHIPGKVAILKAREVVGGLVKGTIKVFSARFVLDK
jgi:hypothetical protein